MLRGMTRFLPLFLCLFSVVCVRGMDTTTIGIARVLDEPTADSREMTLMFRDTEEKLQVDRNVRLHDRDFRGVELVEGPEVGIRITLTPEGTAKLTALTREALGKRLAIFTDGRLLSAPTVREVISSDSLMITGNMTRKEAEELVAAFAKGKANR